MWVSSRYVGTRDPSRGGLHISATTEGFDEAVSAEIYDNCLELIAKEKGSVCTGIYPLKGGKYSIAMGYKVAGSMKESRPHEVIRGIVASPEELVNICETYVAEGNAKKLFFSSEPDPDKPEDWKISKLLKPASTRRMGEFWSELDYKDVLGFAGALREIRRRKYKVRLSVPEGKKQIVLAACCMMMAQTGVRLFVMADGECTLAMPDLIIADELLYLDSKTYRSMTLEQFIHMGNAAKGAEGTEEEKEADEAAELLRFCNDYLVSGEYSDHLLYQKLNEMQQRDRTQYSGFKISLKNQLYEFKGIDCYTERYMKLLYAAFKLEPRDEQVSSMELCTAPYDFRGMYLLLKKKARSGRELRRYLVAMVATQFSECADYFSDKAIQKAAVNIINNL